MKLKQQMIKRLLAVVLSISLVIALIPVLSLPTEAAAADQKYVSLPITIRDYAADGMLFEYNDMGQTGDFKNSKTYAYSAVDPAWEYDGYKGIRICTYGKSSWAQNATWWHCIICTGDGTVVKVLGNGQEKGAAYNNAMKSGYFAVFAWSDASNREAFNAVSVVTENNKNQYKITYNTLNKTIALTETYHYGNTLGYGLLQTTAASHFNDLTNSAAIPGTVLTQNGTWNSRPENIIPIKQTLNSGAKQELFGAYVRTDLVEPNLVDGKIVYTEATVTYLADYMRKTLPAAWTNSDGTHNMWHVMGTKLFDNNNNYVGPVSDAVKDLASVLRSCITGGLGSYAATKGKTLTKVTDCETYFDAAYFLLHNIYTDNAGYGDTVKEYSKLNMVEKTDAKGNTFYVFNSAYDNAKYDVASGEIYNTQTDIITTRKGTTYVRGNLQPEARFDPIGAIGDGNAYYGKNGSRYLNAADPDGHSNEDKENLGKYYPATNYNLSLEGHAKFIYYQDSKLYFTFTGDDDVYLYINGIRVLDMGGAHAISKTKISLNDVAEMCGLEDGKSYDFDFFYMERHGTAANFGIETNIKIVDPHMLTTKTGFQNGGEVGYNGFVNPEKPVTYQFTLQNNGDANIQDLTFKDDDIGVHLTKDNIQLNAETKISDLRVTHADAQGAVIGSWENLQDDTELKNILATGLKIGEKLTVYGFNYTIPDKKWENNAFINYVYTTAVSHGENTSTQTLNGIADYKVQKQEFVFDNLHYYEWRSKGVTAEKAELLAPVEKVVKNLDSKNATIQLCTPSGNPDGILNKHVTLNNNAATYTGDVTGADNYFYLVNVGSETYGPVRVDVYTYDVADNTYVLDYGLPVELNEGEAALTSNDVVSLVGINPYATAHAVTGISRPTSNYGDFSFKNESQSLKYTLDKFMSDIDTVTVTVEVKEEGADTVTKTTGVTMTQTITTAPANVMYYEDTFADITYIGEDGNEWLLYETTDAHGNEQSADQGSNYGSDPNYEEDRQGELVLNDGDLSAEDKATLAGDASNGSIHEMEIAKTGYILQFDFTGTGFEIVSRTTVDDYAVLMTEVYKTAELAANPAARPVKMIPVITESKGGDLYQVPIISVTGLDRDAYTVKLKGAKSAGVTRLVYIDGIRIYGALAHDKELEYYNPEEANAEFIKIKEQIGKENIVYAAIDSDKLFVTGSTVIEDREDSGLVLTEAADVNEYLKFGPNNELYLDGTGEAQFIGFYLTEDENVSAEARTIEIGAHRKSDSIQEESELVKMVYGSIAEEIDAEINSYEIKGGTEQYYTIDVSKLTKDEDGRYLVLIGTIGGDNNFANTLALTNLKISGYTLSSAKDELVQAAEENNPEVSPMIYQFTQYYDMLHAPVQPQEPVNENLKILSAKLKSNKVVSGKTVNLTVLSTLEGKSVQVIDQNGNEPEFTKVKKNDKKADGAITFDLSWTAAGEKGEVQTYKVRVLDAGGAYSVNEESVEIEVR